MTEVATRDDAGASLFVWKASCFALSCFCGCASGVPPAGQDDNEFNVVPRKSVNNYAVADAPAVQQRTSIRQSAAANASMDAAASADEPDAATSPSLKEHVTMVGIFSDWKFDNSSNWMDQAHEWPADLPPLPDKMVRLRKSVQLTSASFSFQVICPEKEWNWRLYPRDFKAVFWGAHVSKQGVMKSGNREKVIVGVGDKKKGDGMNMHVVGYEKDVVTIWMDMPVKPNDDGTCSLDTSSEDKLARAGGRAPKIWFVDEDKASFPHEQIGIRGGDGKDIEAYRHRLAET